MDKGNIKDPVIVIGAGAVGAAVAFTLAHRGVSVRLIEREPDAAYAASGTNSGCLHTGFDSPPGELETQLILRSAQLRPAVLEALRIPVLECGAVLSPTSEADRSTIDLLVENAQVNGVHVEIRESDGSLLVPGEHITDPVKYTKSLVASAQAAGVEVTYDTTVVGIKEARGGLEVLTSRGDTFRAPAVVNAAGLFSDQVAQLAADESFEIYPRKGEFLVFEQDEDDELDHIILPVPTKRTKGVLLFPSLDGKVITGPTAVDGDDKTDWRVRPSAREELLDKAVQHLPSLQDKEPVFSYAGLRTAGRNDNYVIRHSAIEPRLIHAAAVRSTGLSASLGIGEYVAQLVEEAGVPLEEPRDIVAGVVPAEERPWWSRTAAHFVPKGARQG
jgi:glycerol-3-phosphate dehydrogenase